MRSWLHPVRRLSQQALLAAAAAAGMLALGSQSLAAEHVDQDGRELKVPWPATAAGSSPAAGTNASLASRIGDPWLCRQTAEAGSRNTSMWSPRRRMRRTCCGSPMVPGTEIS